jgi:uncharacterized OsmC-like protein
MTTANPGNQAHLNGINTPALFEVMDAVKADPSKGMVKFHVKTGWTGQTSSQTTVESYTLGGQEIPRKFAINIDEPNELLGTNTYANPQEYLMAAFNACILVGYVVGASVHNIRLDKLEIETEGELDLRGFLGLDSTVKPGYDTLTYTVRIKGDGSAEQFQEIHDTVIKTSPNRFNIANPIHLEAKLVVES